MVKTTAGDLIIWYLCFTLQIRHKRLLLYRWGWLCDGSDLCASI